MQEGQSGTGLPPNSRRSLLVILTFIFFYSYLFRLFFSAIRAEHAAHDLSQHIAGKHQRHQAPALTAADPHYDDQRHRQVHCQEPPQ